MRGITPLPKFTVPSPEDDAADMLRPNTAIPDGINVGAWLRKKGRGIRSWLLLDSTGQTQVVEVGKHAIIRRTGLPPRDLRILDPLLSYPSTVLGRERAIVINLEHIKAIITGQEVLLLNARDPSVSPFVEELQRRILRHYQATKSQEAGGGCDNAVWTNLYDPEEPQSGAVSPPNFSASFRAKDENKADGKQQAGKNRVGRSFSHLSLLLWRHAWRLLAVVWIMRLEH